MQTDQCRRINAERVINTTITTNTESNDTEKGGQT